MIDDLFLLI